MPRLLLRLALAGLLLAVGALSFTRAAALRYDFHHFFLDAQYTWQHGELNPDLDNPDPLLRRQLPFYLPTVPLALAPLGALGSTGAAAIWAVAQVAALAAALALLARWSQNAGAERGALPAAVLLALPAVYEAARFNQLSFPILALLSGCLLALQRRRDTCAGALLALAAVIKLLPAFLVVWLALRSRWRALLAFGGAAAALALFPCLMCFGPQRTWDYHRQWWRLNVDRALARPLATPGVAAHFSDHRNQALGEVVERFFDPAHPQRAPLAFAALAPAARQSLTRVLIVGLLSALIGALWVRRKHRQGAADGRDDVDAAPSARAAEGSCAARPELAALLLALLIFSPLLRQYYLVWALPALLVFAEDATGAVGSARRFARAGLGIWLLGMLLWLWPAARLCGVHWFMLVMMAALLLARPVVPTALRNSRTSPRTRA